MENKWVSVQEASKLLGVCKDTVRSWVDTGKLKAYITPTKHRKISIEDIKKMVNDENKKGTDK